MENEPMLLTPRDAGRELGEITTSAVIKLSERGELPTLRDSGGRRLFRLEDVLALKKKREARRREKQRRASSSDGAD
jgi:hypothetical protein